MQQLQNLLSQTEQHCIFCASAHIWDYVRILGAKFMTRNSSLLIGAENNRPENNSLSSFFLKSWNVWHSFTSELITEMIHIFRYYPSFALGTKCSLYNTNK